jgi:hypothetical protein
MEMIKTKKKPLSILDFERALILATHLLRYIKISQIKRWDHDMVSSYVIGYFLKYNLSLSLARCDELLTFMRYLINKLWHNISLEQPDLET